MEGFDVNLFSLCKPGIALIGFLTAIVAAAISNPANAQTPPAPVPAAPSVAPTPPAAPAPAATPAPSALRRSGQVASPDIAADGTITFRLKAPNAHEVGLNNEWGHPMYVMAKDPDSGIWSVTTEAIPPGVYGYSFKVDGTVILDPSNKRWKPARNVVTSMLTVPGISPVHTDWDPGIPHGVIHLHEYESSELGYRRMRVYTPAAYDEHPKQRFPVLYLLHGSGDNEATWTEFGRANLILDNMIAEGTVKPMIVVMPDGHTDSAAGEGGTGAHGNAFETDLLQNIMPLVEKEYRTEPDRDHRAIAGLSMGGGQSLRIGLLHRDLFAWIGGMSSAIGNLSAFDPFFAARDADDKQYPIRLLWFAEGKNDFLLADNHAFDALLTAKGVPHEYVETDGIHEWKVWRRDLTVLAPRLFQ